MLVYCGFQLDCCGKGDDTPLFKQVANTLCPTKSAEDLLLSQVNSILVNLTNTSSTCGRCLHCVSYLSELSSQTGRAVFREALFDWTGRPRCCSYHGQYQDRWITHDKRSTSLVILLPAITLKQTVFFFSI